jgi:hypothetical protein
VGFVAATRDQELKRHRQAGATDAAAFAFPGTDDSLDDFFETELAKRQLRA